MKILITGATGLIGNVLTQTLLLRGHTIHYLSSSNKKLLDQPEVKGFYWNPAEGAMDHAALANVEAIVHLAGASIAKRWTSKYKQQIVESRSLSANLLYKAIKNFPNHKVRQIVSASAIGIYRDSLSAEYREDSRDFDEGFLGNVVVKWEQSIDKFQLLNVAVCKIRTGLVLAEKGGVLAELEKPVRLSIGSAFGSGKQWQSWIHIDDLAAIYCAAVEQCWEGTFNAVAPEPVTNSALVQTLATHLRKPFFMPNVPRLLMKLLLGDMHLLLFSSQKVSAAKLSEKGFAFRYPTLERALDDLRPKV